MPDTYRDFLRNNIFKQIDFARTDQNRGVEPPPLQKPCPAGTKLTDLTPPGQWKIPSISLEEAIAGRRSRRSFNPDPVSLDELSFILWATQGVRAKPTPVHALRTVPSAGCRHAFETYLAAFRVKGLPAALYRYLPLSHQLALLDVGAGLADRLAEAASGQAVVSKSAFALVWTAIPYRMEWRYGLASSKLIALDAGHVCHSLYLASAAIQAGVCAIAAYDQAKMDGLLGVDGNEEFTVYMAAAGKIST